MINLKMKVFQDSAVLEAEKNNFYLLKNAEGRYVQHKSEVDVPIKFVNSIVDLIQSVRVNLSNLF